MKVHQLLENEVDEPLLTTILRNALAKGKEVRVYYKGDGGRVKAIEWEPPSSSKRTADYPGSGASFFKLLDDRWVVIGDHNLEKLEITKRGGEHGPEIIVAKQPYAAVTEGMMDGRNWVDQLNADFMKIIRGAGWTLNRKPSYGLEHGYFGGTIRATAAAKRSLLDLTEQRRYIMKLLGKKFIELAAEGLSVTVTPRSLTHAKGRSNGRLIVNPHTQLELIIDTFEDGMHIKLDGSAFEIYWNVSIPEKIVAHVQDEFSKALGRESST